MLTSAQLPHVIAFLLLLARIGDVGSTYLISPTLKLEANPIIRRLRWPFASMSVLVAAAPYYSVPLALTLLVGSLLVCASNCSRMWIARTMGESEYHRFLTGVARQTPRGLGVLYCLLSPPCMATIGGVIFLFYPSMTKTWAAWIGYGFVLFALIMGLYGSQGFLRLRREGIALAAQGL
jgi:hypothetical protein